MNGDMPCLAAAAIADQISMNTAPPVGERSWPYLEFLRNTPVFSRESQASAGELNNSVSPSWRGLAVRPTRRPGQQGQHHAPPGSFLGRLDQEFPQRDIDVNIVEFELKAAFTSAGQTMPAVALFSRSTRLSSSRSARVILIRRWQPAMAHLTGTLLGISLGGVVKSAVIPARVGIRINLGPNTTLLVRILDSRLRGNDGNMQCRK